MRSGFRDRAVGNVSARRTLSAVSAQRPRDHNREHVGKNHPGVRRSRGRLDAESDGIAALEINISCPNVKAGGSRVRHGSQTRARGGFTRPLQNETAAHHKTQPERDLHRDFARAVVDAGSDMVSLINTIPGMSIDIETCRPRIANRTGGFSGPALKPIAVRMVYDVAHAVKVPVIGMGGIMNGDDAIEFFLAGASAVAVGTANFVDPYAALKVIDEINTYLDATELRACRKSSGRCADRGGGTQWRKKFCMWQPQ